MFREVISRNGDVEAILYRTSEIANRRAKHIFIALGFLDMLSVCSINLIMLCRGWYNNHILVPLENFVHFCIVTLEGTNIP